MGAGDSEEKQKTQQTQKGPTTRIKGKWTANSMIGEPAASCTLLARLIWTVILSFLPYETAGAGGGLVASIATCPLDVVKTKLQAQRAIQGQRGYLGVLGTSFLLSCILPDRLTIKPVGTVKNILYESGIRGMYRGLGPTILGYLPTWAIYFAVYDGIKTAFGEPPSVYISGSVKGEKEHERLYPAAQVKGYQPAIREHPWSLHILSAMTAGAASTICTNPLWVIKTRFMVRVCQSSGKHTLTWSSDPDARGSPLSAYS